MATSTDGRDTSGPFPHSVWIWCPGTELNRRHEDFQSSALPTELPGHEGQELRRETITQERGGHSTDGRAMKRHPPVEAHSVRPVHFTRSRTITASSRSGSASAPRCAT